MKNSKLFALLLVLIFASNVSGQRKKVAVVTFYANKMVGYDQMGIGLGSLLEEVTELRDNPNFNLEPMLEQYHSNFFNNYSKKFPFDLLPESDVVNNEGYKKFEPIFDLDKYEAKNYLIYDQYKYIYEGMLGKSNEINTAKLFADQADGVMFVSINFRFVTGFGIGIASSANIQAFTRIALYNKKGEKVFAINESKSSKKSSMMIGGVPVTDPKEVLPMCESALQELMVDLDKRIEKIVRKSADKL